MSAVTGSLGSARNSAHVHVRSTCRRSRSRTSTGRGAYTASGRPRAPGSHGSRTGREARGPDRRPRRVAGRESRVKRGLYRFPSSCEFLLVLRTPALAPRWTRRKSRGSRDVPSRRRELHRADPHAYQDWHHPFHGCPLMSVEAELPDGSTATRPRAPPPTRTSRTSPRVSLNPLERARTEPELAPGFLVRCAPEPRRVVDRVGA